MMPTQSHMLISKEKNIPCFLTCFIISHERDTEVLSTSRDTSGLGTVPLFQALATKKMESHTEQARHNMYKLLLGRF